MKLKSSSSSDASSSFEIGLPSVISSWWFGGEFHPLVFFFAPLFPVSDCPRVDNVGSSASLSLLN
jgi:hypothetical protein